MIFAATPEAATLLVELGAILVALALLGRLAARFGIPSIPLYLVAGLAVGEGGIVELVTAREFIESGATIGVILLLLLLGLEYTGEELTAALQNNVPSGMVDLVLNFSPGLLLGAVLGWDYRAALLLGGITYISSSGIIAKVLEDLGNTGNRETPVVLAILVTEDLVMALYLPLMAGLLIGGSALAIGIEVTVAITAVMTVLLIAIRFGDKISAVVFDRSDENLLLSLLGLALLVAGIAEHLQASAAVGAFVVGIALNGPAEHAARNVLGPLKHLFAAMFFAFFGLQINPADLPPALALAIGLALVTAATKMATGWWSAKEAGISTPGRIRAGATLVARGEFSIVIAGIAVAEGIEPELGPLAAAYVLILAVCGPLLARSADPIARQLGPRLQRTPTTR
ncbi:MAG: cation:proton antiporter [Acidimicrobiales bacterium]|nr:cation:proton antiporter [Acidimicrobiales bacterium]